MQPPFLSRHAHPFLDGPHPRAMAHRGWHAGDLSAAENTLGAFEQAVAEGFDYVETDARVTADGVAVLHHDAVLGRLSAVRGPIAAFSVAELSSVVLGGGWPVPRLDEVLRAMPHTRFNIDVKTDDAVAPVLTAVSEADAGHRVCLAAFSDVRLARLRTLGPRTLLTSLGPRAVAVLRVRSVLPFAVPSRGRVGGSPAQVPPGPPLAPLIDRRFVNEAHRRGREVHAWTVDDPVSMVRLLDLGVDGIITDAPDVLRAVLDSRGQWRPGAVRDDR